MRVFLALIVFSFLLATPGFSQQDESDGGDKEKTEKLKEPPKMETKKKMRDFRTEDKKFKNRKSKRKESREIKRQARKNKKDYKKLRRKQQNGKTTRRMKRDERKSKKVHTKPKKPLGQKIRDIDWSFLKIKKKPREKKKVKHRKGFHRKPQ